MAKPLLRFSELGFEVIDAPTAEVLHLHVLEPVPAPSSGFKSGASRRLQLERLPGYAPDLNPDEGGWNWLKNVEMKNLCCRSIDHLKTELRRAKERLRHKTRIIKSFFREVGLV